MTALNCAGEAGFIPFPRGRHVTERAGVVAQPTVTTTLRPRIAELVGDVESRLCRRPPSRPISTRTLCPPKSVECHRLAHAITRLPTDGDGLLQCGNPVLVVAHGRKTRAEIRQCANHG